MRSFRVLVVDDDSARHRTFARNLIGHIVVHARTHAEAVEAFAKERFDVVYLDHDLNLIGEFRSVGKHPETGLEIELTGADVAKELVALPKEKHPELVIVHSYNPSGAANIMSILRGQIDALQRLFSATSGSEIS